VVRLREIPLVVSGNVAPVFLAPRCSAFPDTIHALAAICSSGCNVPVSARFAGEVQPSPIRLRCFARHLAHGAGGLLVGRGTVFSGEQISSASRLQTWLLLLADPPFSPRIAFAGFAEIYAVAWLATERLKFSREFGRASAVVTGHVFWHRAAPFRDTPAASNILRLRGRLYELQLGKRAVA
jgi:hypothetical protein